MILSTRFNGDQREFGVKEKTPTNLPSDKRVPDMSSTVCGQQPGVTLARGHTPTVDFATGEGTWNSVELSPDVEQ